MSKKGILITLGIAIVLLGVTGGLLWYSKNKDEDSSNNQINDNNQSDNENSTTPISYNYLLGISYEEQAIIKYSFDTNSEIMLNRISEPSNWYQGQQSYYNNNLYYSVYNQTTSKIDLFKMDSSGTVQEVLTGFEEDGYSNSICQNYLIFHPTSTQTNPTYYIDLSSENLNYTVNSDLDSLINCTQNKTYIAYTNKIAEYNINSKSIGQTYDIESAIKIIYQSNKYIYYLYAETGNDTWGKIYSYNITDKVKSIIIDENIADYATYYYNDTIYYMINETVYKYDLIEKKIQSLFSINPNDYDNYAYSISFVNKSIIGISGQEASLILYDADTGNKIDSKIKNFLVLTN